MSAEESNCPCDESIFPRPLDICAGLAHIPRQVATFPEFRRAMLDDIDAFPALRGWLARDEDDLGAMLLEMWAYVCDALAFYNETYAHEAYLRTARLRPSLRKLVGILGYVPRPAVAARAYLAALAEGRKPLTLPLGTAFRSGAFDGGKPQVFELDAETVVHPLLNRWTLAAPLAGTLGDDPNLAAASGGVATGTLSLPYLLVETGGPTLKAGKPLLVTLAGEDYAVRVPSAVEDYVGTGGNSYIKLVFDEAGALELPADTRAADIVLQRATQSAGLWTLTEPDNLDEDVVTLDGLHRQIKAGDPVLLSHASGEVRRYRVVGISEIGKSITLGEAFTAVDVDGDEVELTSSPVLVPATRLTLDADVNATDRMAAFAPIWDDGHVGQLTLLHGLQEAGTVALEASPDIPAGVAARAFALPTSRTRPLEAPTDGSTATAFLLEDKDGSGALVSGTLDFSARTLELDPATDLDAPLLAPLTAYGNILQVSRGETVAAEILGSGDASRSNQSFALKKGPLTYLSAPTAEGGVASTLMVRVDGVLWAEAATFYGKAPEDRIYIVRQDDEGVSTVTFGDGKRGARLPSGTGNVTAAYRFGAGKASPPAGALNQVAKPVKGLTAVRNPLDAFGGDDAEAADSLAGNAPKSAWLLGRAVSIQDFQAAAAQVAGVRAARAEWRWHATRQRAVVQVWYVGDANLAGTVTATLRNLCQIQTPLQAEPAGALPLVLSLQMEVDPAYVEKAVIDAVRAALLDGDGGMLAPENIGIGAPLYRSALAAAVMAVAGVTGITDMQMDGAAFADLAAAPGAGKYFDVESGALILNGLNGLESYSDG